MALTADVLKEILFNQQKQFEQSQHRLLATLSTHFDKQLSTIKSTSDSSNSETASNSIQEFIYNPDQGRTFNKWFQRYAETFEHEFPGRDDAWKCRLLIRKLGSTEFTRYSDYILPKTPGDMQFFETVDLLKQIFGIQQSIFHTRFNCLQLKKSNLDEWISYAGTVNRHCENFQLSSITEDQFKCLIFIAGLDSPRDAELRTKLLTKVSKESNITLQDITRECQQYVNLKNDAMMVQQPTTTTNTHAVISAPKKRPPTPCWNCGRVSRQGNLSPQKSPLPPKSSPKEIDVFLKNTEQVTAVCHDNPNEPYQFGDSPSRPLSEAQKLRKVIMELLETERTYVKDLNCLIERYLNPLKAETLLTLDEIMQLFGNIQEIVPFQKQFLQSLEEAVKLGGNFFTLDDPKEFRDEKLRRVLFSLGGSFLYYANHFKVYSSFCASHSRSQKILNPDANAALKEFLLSRNPKQQHSCTLESFLIKPIQRILKYPLLLQQLCQLTDPDTDEHYHLSEALRGMQAVAEHINEMQKIYEEYGFSFDELSRMHKELHPHNKLVDLSVGELQMYGTVQWCNAIDFLGKIKKGTDLENAVFIFKTGIVFLCRERVKRKFKKSSGNRNTPLSGGYDAIPRFRTLIPVHEVQVVSGSRTDCERHYWWQLIHSKSEIEGRPEKLYQFCNCTSEAKTDFMKVIRQTIRDSVRKMAVPSARQTAKTTYIPFGGKRLECLGSNPRTLSKIRGRFKAAERHSLDFEENFNNSEYDSMFRTRSKTVGNLNEVAQGKEGKDEPEADQVPARPASSIANPYSTAPHGISNKHLRAAGQEQQLVSRPTFPRPTGGGLPVWKPRQGPSGGGGGIDERGYMNMSMTSKPGTPAQVLPPHAVATALSSSEASTPTTSSAYGDYSDVVYRADTPSRVITHQPSRCIAYKDTEC